MNLGTYICDQCKRECPIGYGFTSDDCVHCGPCGDLVELHDKVVALEDAAIHFTQKWSNDPDGSTHDAVLLLDRIAVATARWLSEWKDRKP